MSDFSLVPVDYQPDFSDVSFIPVDHDPFGGDGTVQSAGTQPVQPQPVAAGFPPDVVAPTKSAPENNLGESYDPDSSDDSVASRAAAQDSVAALSSKRSPVDWTRSFQPTGELKVWTPAPTQRIGYLAADGLMGLGMKPYIANDLVSRIGNVLGLTPLGVFGSALNLIDAKHRDDLPDAVAAAVGMIPGAKKLTAFEARNVVKEITLSRLIHGEAATHAADAIKAGHPSVLTINRPGRNANRWLATGKLDKVAGKHLDEYPPAMFREGGFEASVRPIEPHDNKSAGAYVGNLCRGLPDGARIRISVGD
ncbi:NucA/NucB deoxyribonuclease domain-containing protein [Bradyrhizobium ivorense]|uniref:NucA/NucB deoxyribonuclease domain-containing protein n=1 Tax=Bradyrhizobium ivorense TaxID=2511166 RepID=UPI00155A6469|nr:NucA/NucB deoxyribonuclease domain-containing protein [Bradyrhizobium ivorense]